MSQEPTPHQTDIESVIQQDETGTPASNIALATNGHAGTNGKAVVKARVNGNGKARSVRPENAAGLKVERRFTKPGDDVYSTVEWELRDAVISNERGEKVFEQKDVEIPKSWTQLATNVVVSKYFRGHIGTPQRERSVRQLIGRVADTIANWGREMAYFASEEDAQAFQDELTHILLHQKAAFNSPVWFNVGLADQPRPQASACFINSVDDTMESILTLAKTEGMLFKYGSGTGTNLSTIRGSREPLVGGGTASGPLSFMRGFDQFAGAIKSGGKCFKAGTLVATPDGWVPIETLLIGDMVLTHRGPRAVADFMPNGQKQCYKVTTAEGYEVEVTQGHKFAYWNADEGRFEVKPIEQFQSGDALYVLLEASEGGTRIPLFVPDAHDAPQATTTREMKFPTELTDELGYILGLMYGDAELRREYPFRVRVAFCKDEAGQVSSERFRQYSLNQFGEEPKLLHDATGHQQIGFTRKRLIEFLVANGIAKGKAEKLGFPSVFFQARPEVRAAFIAGVIDADGTYQQRGGWSVSSIDRPFLVEFQRLLLTLGVPSKIKVSRAERGNWKSLYRLHIIGHTFIDRLVQRIASYSAKVQVHYVPSAGEDKGWGYRPSLFRPLAARVEWRGGYGIMERAIGMNETTGYRGLSRLVAHPHASIATYAEELSHCVQVRLESVTSTEVAETYDIEVEGVHLLCSNGLYASNTRRAAKMVILDIDHPDIEDFITSKEKEEKKAWALIDAGYSGAFNVSGGAYDSVQFQNANHSVRVTDEFMQAVEQDGEWKTHFVLSKKASATYKARDLMAMIGASAWVCGDPGMQYDTTINKWHTCKNTDRIYASNPCCFVGETLVNTTKGSIRFDELERLSRLGGAVPCALSFDTQSGKYVTHSINKVWVAGETCDLVDVRTTAGIVLRCTPDHRFLTFDGKYVPAVELKSGTRLRTSSAMDYIPQQETAPAYDEVASVATVKLDTPVKVYDLEVDEVHNLTVTTAEKSAPHGIVVSNSEYMFLNDSACNLASLNLMKFRREDGEFDNDAFKYACRILITAQEILVDNASYPTPRIAENSHDYRPLGLGYANLGALLMARGLAYDSDEGRAYAGAITSIMTGEAYYQSANIARDHGWPFPGYPKNREPFLEVMRMHRAAVEDIDSKIVPADMLAAARQSWDDAIVTGEQHGYRNAQATVLAPTGCLVANSLVLTDRGLMRLNRLGNVDGDTWQDVNFRVLTDEGERAATKFYVNGIEETRRITTACGYAIQGTYKHRIKVVDAMTGEWQWKRFSDITAGDIVPLAMGQLAGESRTVNLPPLGEEYWTGDYTTRVPHTMTPELAELIGYFMGDGSLHSKGPRFCVSNVDRDVAEHLRDRIKSLFNLDARLIDQQGYCEVSVHSVPLALWWEACGFAKFAPHAGHSGKGYLPHIPDAVLATNDPKVYGAFLRGLYEADGTVTNGVPHWCSTHQEFSTEVKTLLLALGLPTTVKQDMSAWGQATVYTLRLRNLSYNGRFLEVIGFLSARKAGRVSRNRSEQTARHDYIYPGMEMIAALMTQAPELVNALTLSMKRHQGGITRRAAEALYAQTGDPHLGHALQFFYDTVAANEDGGEQLTYDLSVPDNVTYIANGFVSHNTIGFLMDCDTTGIEPDIAIVKYKSLVGGGMLKIVNNTVPEALQRLGYTQEQITAILAYIDEKDTIEGAPELKLEHLPVFDCAFKPANGERSIHYMGHVKMMAAAQPFLSGAISKTVNMPNEATAEDIGGVYMEGWKLGLKAIAIYRDGSKRTQPLSTKKADVEEAKAEPAKVEVAPVAATPAPVAARPMRRKLPDERYSITHKFSIAGHEGYITVGMYEDGTPGEIFLTMSKEGSTISGLMDSFATAISLALQYGVPLQTLVDKFAHSRFEPSGITNNPDVRFAKSIMDYIFRWLGTKFLPRVPENDQPSLSNGHSEESAQANVPALSGTSATRPTLTLTAVEPTSLADRERETFQNQADAPICTECGSLMVRNGACFKCLNCGSVFGCS